MGVVFWITPFRGLAVVYLLATREGSTAGITDLYVSSDNRTNGYALERNSITFAGVGGQFTDSSGFQLSL